MKKTAHFLAIILVILLAGSCKNTARKNVSVPVNTTLSVNEGLLLIGKDIITEAVIKPDTLGDPWEVEKVKGFNGKEMFVNLFENISNRKLTVYDCFTGEALDPADVRKMEKEIGKDISKIGKMIFQEDWYFNPLTNSVSKKIKSITFGYEIIREDGLPRGYKPLFKLKTE